MKKALFSILFIFICVAIKKSNALLVDYRDNYTGTYFCNFKLQVAIDTLIHSDTLTIVISKNDIDSLIDIKIGRIYYQAVLNESSSFLYNSNKGLSGNFFSTDSINLRLKPSLGFIYNFKGKEELK